MRYARVDVDFFRALARQAIAGRVFEHTDVEGGPAPVVVNAPFVERVLAGRDPLRSRVRLQGGTAWHQIIGVVPHLGVNMVNRESGGVIYFPAAPGQINPFQVGIHVGASPTGMAPRVRETATKIDPNLMMGTPVVLSDVIQGDLFLTLAMAGGLALLVGVLIVLAVSGIYAILSLSVSERTREIGIRTALGAEVASRCPHRGGGACRRDRGDRGALRLSRAHRPGRGDRCVRGAEGRRLVSRGAGMSGRSERRHHLS